MAAAAALDAAAIAAAGAACFAAGRAAQRARLPQITGFLVAGIVAGPAGLGLVSARLLAALAPVEAACLGAIAFAAGAELHLSELQRTRRQVLCITAAVALASWLAVGGCLLAAARAVPFLAALERTELLAVASLGGTLAMARSPASAIAVLRETEAAGPYCSLVMAVVVVKDVLVFVAFAANLEVVSAVMRHSGGGASFAALAHPAMGLAMSASLGIGGGALLGAALATSVPGVLRPRVPQAAVLRGKSAAMFVAAAAVYWAAAVLDAEPLLACVTAGLLVANRRSEGASRDVQEELATGLAAVMPAVNPVFFGIVGASVRVRSLLAALWAAALLAVVRAGAVWVGSYVGSRLGRAEPEIGRRLWQGMITQAGIAMGLAKAVAARFPSWGQDFSTLMIGVILFNMLSGPSLFRAAIVALGESRRRGLQDTDSRTLTKGKTRSPEHIALELPPLSVTSPAASPGDAHPVAGLRTPVALSPRHQHRSPVSEGGSPAVFNVEAGSKAWQGSRPALDGQAARQHLRVPSGGSPITTLLHTSGTQA